MRLRCLLLICISLILSFWLGTISPCPASAAPLTWDTNAQGQFVTSLCRDNSGHVWIGTEDQGVWRCDPSASKDKQYTHYTTKDGLGDDNAYALTCDKAGRVWVGTLNHGVSVFNGKTWRTYGPVDGPLGSRVFALAVSPKDGGVWGATEAGLFRYQNSRWTYFTRAEGLPSDQAQALAFAPDGTLYVGTQCDGIAVGSPDDNYKTWRVTPGPAALPNTATGRGLPSALINCLLVTSDNTVFAGTTTGLARSRDGGETWTFVRGLDWKAKLAGLYHPALPAPSTYTGDLLTEDYVTALAEDERGRLFVGHRQTGVEAFEAKTGKRLQSGASGAKTDAYAFCLLTAGRSAWVGQYGGGLLPPADIKADAAPASSSKVVDLPVPAAPPTLAELNAMTAKVKSQKGEMPVGGGAYLGEDWQTQGDWLGHYGRQSAVLLAADAPLDHDIISDPAYRIRVAMGPHHPTGDSIRRYDSQTRTDNPRSLYDPIPGYRRQSEADDHGEAIVGPNKSFAYQGPDIWVTLTVPSGLHHVSLYDFNKDGHGDDNRFRDYFVDILPYRSDEKVVQAEVPLAHARIHNFWGGVYNSFLLRGPSRYVIRIARNGSLNTILPGIFVDRIGISKPLIDCKAWMGGVSYAPPDPDAPIPPDPHLLDKLLAKEVSKQEIKSLSENSVPQSISLARTLWSELDKEETTASTSSQQASYRLLTYRAISNNTDLGPLQAAWRWNLHLWTLSDRQQFAEVTHQAHETLLTLYPDMRNHKY